MPDRCIFYYITDRRQFPGNEASQRTKLLDKIGEAARCGVEFIQLREKDLSTRDLEQLTGDALGVIRNSSPGDRDSRLETKLLINSRSDVALALGADGVHLRSDDFSVPDARAIASSVLGRASPSPSRAWHIAVSCHTEQDVAKAAADGSDFVVFAPVFGKSGAGSRAAGLIALQRVCRNAVPVLALGGVTIENAESCLEAGAAGVAGIRLFQDNNIAEVIRRIGR